MRIGVLAYQGSVAEHINSLKKIKEVKPVEVKNLDGLLNIDALILPGGESTTISKLLHIFNLFEPLKQRILDGMPVWGTCAGMILLAKEVEGQEHHLGVMDIAVRRNAYGSQSESFSKKIFVKGINKECDAVFIRAPWIEKVFGKAETLAEENGHIVAARQKNMLATSFHPELTDDTAFHRFFVETVKKA